MENQNEDRIELIDLYAEAAGCLYSALSISEFVNVFNYYEDEKTTEREVTDALQWLVETIPDSLEYTLYNDIIVGPLLYPEESKDDVEYLIDLRRIQEDKPRYLPASKEEFLMHSNPFYIEPQKPYDDLKEYIQDNNLLDESLWGDIDDDLQDLHEMIQYNIPPEDILHFFIDLDYQFHDLDQTNDFLQKIMTVYNNTRLPQNNGHTPEELRKIIDANRPKEMAIHHPQKVGRNDPCPCGSGKKYKKCCAILEAGGAAQLSFSECKLFYETWYKLLDYVNRKLQVVDYKFSLSYPSQHDELLLHKIRDSLWEKPELISKFLADSAIAGILTDEEISLLQSWEKHYIKGKFLLAKYMPDAAIFMHLEDGKENRLYAVKGMVKSISEAAHRKLPVLLEAVLLPFGDKIVYDSFIEHHPIEFGSNIMEMFNNEYSESENKYGIIKNM